MLSAIVQACPPQTRSAAITRRYVLERSLDSHLIWCRPRVDSERDGHGRSLHCPERDCVEDLPQRLRQTSVMEFTFAKEFSTALRLVLCPRPLRLLGNRGWARIRRWQWAHPDPAPDGARVSPPAAQMVLGNHPKKPPAHLLPPLRLRLRTAALRGSARMRPMAIWIARCLAHSRKRFSLRPDDSRVYRCVRRGAGWLPAPEQIFFHPFHHEIE